MSAIIPYGANHAWHLNNDVREIASHYAVRPRLLRTTDGRHSTVVAAARDALAWKLVKVRLFSAQRAADLLRINEKSVREAVARHVHRIAEHNARPLNQPPALQGGQQ